MKTKITHHQGTTYPQTVEVPAPLEIHPSVSPLAAELLMKTIKRIIVNPEEYNQGECSGRCGSPVCILGHMRISAGLSLTNIDETEQDFASIGLTKPQARDLFWPESWPAQFYDMKSQGFEWDKIPAATGIARIEHFLRTGE